MSIEISNKLEIRVCVFYTSVLGKADLIMREMR